MVFSVRSRSWWRRSSRLLACGRVRATAEESSWPTKTQEVAPAVATAPWSRRHTCINTFAHTCSNTHTWIPHTVSHKCKHRHKHIAPPPPHCVLSWAELPPQTWRPWRSDSLPSADRPHTDTTICTLYNNNAALNAKCSSAFLLMEFEWVFPSSCFVLSYSFVQFQNLG